MPEDLKAIFLDFDGTLADSIGLMRDIYYRFLEEHGKTGAEAEFNSLNGPPLPEIVRILKAAHGLPGTETELLARYEEIIDADYPKAGIMLGARELIEWAASKNIIVAIVTSGKCVWVKRWLAHKTLTEKIAFIIDRDSTKRGKPAPDPYLAALEQAQCAAHEAWAVEDSETGAASALAAGIKTFAVGVPVNNSIPVQSLQDVIDAPYPT